MAEAFAEAFIEAWLGENNARHEPRYKRRTKIVKDRNAPIGTLATQVSRSVYDEFEELAEAKEITKGALLRALVIKYILESREP